MNEPTWDSGLKILPPQIYLDSEVEAILGSIQDSVGNDEFSVMFKGAWGDEGFMVSSDYYIPDQEVSGASVDYDENIGEKREQDGYNVIVHSHPFSTGNTFASGTDEEHVNSHFPCSLISDSEGKVAKAFLRIDTPNHGYKIKIEIDTDDLKYSVSHEREIEGLDKIKKSTYKVCQSHGQGYFNHYEHSNYHHMNAFKESKDDKKKGNGSKKLTKEELEKQQKNEENDYLDYHYSLGY